MQKATSRIPQGVGSPPLPGLDPKKGKIMCIKVRLLDNSIAVFHLGHKATGQALFDEVCRHLNLLESDYFGLIFLDGYGNKCWLDKDKSILRQITSTQSDARFYFVVKFYTPNPAELEEEYTRYLLSLQIRRDLANGEFICNENTAALLVSFIVQAECGDYSFEDYPDHTYLSVTSFIPNQTVSFQINVMEHHQKLVGMTPADADLALLETARRCDFYGIKLHPAKDIEETNVALSVAHMGIKVFHQLNCVSTFSWAKIRKISFKRKRLMIKLHPEAYQYYKDTIEFGFENRNECKNFWKKCVEHHAFFRCLEVGSTTRESKLFSRGSSFHYTGRTQKQLIDYVREHHKRREPFERPLRSSTVARTDSKQRQIQFNLSDAPKPLSYCDGYASVARSTVSAPRRNGNCHLINQMQQQVFYQPELVRAPRPKSVQHQSINDRPPNSQNRPCSSDFESNGNYHMRKSQPRSSVTAFNCDDPMSLSLPNVLAAEEIKVICHEPMVNDSGKMSGKSASGDNFLEQLEISRAEMYDNMSEGSYKLGDHKTDCNHGIDSQSDVTTSSAAPDPRLFANTRFTTKRIGNVIVKKVTPSNKTVIRQNRESSDDDSSSYSDCRNSSASAPAAALNSTRILSANKVRDGFARFRDAIPIPIDGPDVTDVQQPKTPQPKVVQIQTEVAKREPLTNSVNANISLHTVTSSATVATPAVPMTSSTSLSSTIIRPKVISTTTSDMPIRKPIFIKPSENSSSKPLITATKPTVCSTFDSTSVTSNPTVEQSPNSSFRTFIPPNVVITAKSKSPPAETSNESTYGATGPLAGLIITNENLVLTESGITAKPAKPSVPPKPKSLLQKSGQVQHLTTSVDIKVDETKRKEEEDKLLAPLESILNDANDLSTFLSQGASSSRSEKPQPKKPECPAMISIECSDQPDVRRLHFLNGEVPYTLTMRKIQQTEEAQHAAIKNRKSLDLVHRNRLPSQDSFSSQDHSISPTTPEAGNIVEYLLRRRSLSGERNLPRKLRTKRRQTQPVQLSRGDQMPKIDQIDAAEESEQLPQAHETIETVSKASNTTGLLETDF